MTAQDVLNWCWQHPVLPMVAVVMLGLYISSALGYWPAKRGLTRRGREAERKRWDDTSWVGEGRHDEGGGPGKDGRH